MRKTFYLIALAIIVISASCTSKKKNVAVECIETSALGETAVDNIALASINPVVGYFSVVRPTEPTVLAMDKANFEKKFHPAKMMNNRVTNIDFDLRRVGAIVLPATEYDTNIHLDLNNAYIKSNTLYIPYSINTDTEKRSFSSIPAQLFTFGLDLAIDSLCFDNKGSHLKVAI